MSLEALEGRELLTGFSFPDFSNSGGLSLVGSASVAANNQLRLTPALGGKLGAAWYTAEKQFVGLAFETTFQFQLTENFDAPGGSDGFVFIVQNTAPTYLGGGGGALGYYGLRNSLAVEFDTYQNFDDPSQTHISVHTNGTGLNGPSESLSLGSYDTSPALLDDAAVHSVKIAYSPGSLSVYLDDLTTPKLTVAIDLAEKLGLDAGKAWVGFTAATGGGWQNHDILNWNYTVLPDVSTTISVNDASVVEGNSGSSDLVFTVTREGDTSSTTTVDWATENRTATSGGDYAAASGQVVFAPGVTQQTVAISVNGDAAVEPDETFALRLSGVVGATAADGLGLGTIRTDDVTISVGDASAIEGSTTPKILERFVAEGSGGLVTPRGSVFGPDGNGDDAQDLYVTSATTSAILRYDGVTGAFIDAFVPQGGGGLENPGDLAFGPDGNLYVSDVATGKVLEFSASGSFLSEVVSGLAKPLGLTFGPDGSLFITSQDSDEVLRYNNSGLSVFVGAGSGGLDQPRQAVFGPDGNLYVASQGTGAVLRYDGQTGAFLDTFAATNLGQGPTWLEFGTDGYLYVSVRTTTANANTSIVRFNAVTGALVDRLDLERDGWSFILGPDNRIYNSSNGAGNFIDRLGPSSLAAFTVSLSSASALPVSVNYGTANQTAAAGGDYDAASGTLTFAPGETTKTILVSTRDDAVLEPAETFTVNLSSAAGAVIADGQGIATVLDDDTKFYVVNDGSPDRTYEYGSTGLAGENYSLNSGNTAPRGAAGTVAGDKVWVVDANKKVYVYDAAGVLLGSWTAGGMNPSAAIEGIATDGVDLWLVDAKQDKVFRYTNAASRISGSQTAAGSFSLNSGNSNPKDIVTDGASLWVVNDSTTDKVFKYNLSGTLLGSWTITGAGSSPTGITLDPTGGGTLWVVDNGTDRVYQFDNARSRTSGSQSPTTSFALAAGNTNPQGIADPPVPTSSSSRPAGRSGASADLKVPRRATFRNPRTSTGSGGRPTPANLPHVVRRPEPLILIPPSSLGDQTLTKPAAESLRAGTRRFKTLTRS